ncbi:MAG: beta-lactamase family protein [Oscillospiraceae bacterium]|nr:beta-lactamase family protein [Oscillospiraceae bacterium]
MKKRKGLPSIGELLIISAAVIIMIAVCAVFVIGIGGSEDEPEPVSTDAGADISGADISGVILKGISTGISTKIPTGLSPGQPDDINNPSSTGYETVQDPQEPSRPVPDPQRDAISVISIEEYDPSLFADLNTESASHGSMAVGFVIYDGYSGTFYTYEYGFSSKEDNRRANTNTKYRVASLSKLVTMVCAMALVDRNLLDLDEDISVYLGYTARSPAHRDVPITSRMLMQHTSTVFDSQSFENSILRSVNRHTSTKDLLAQRGTYSGKEPGTAYHYTNFGYSILGAVIEHITGKKLDDVADEFLFSPLDIDAAFVSGRINDKNNVAAMYNSNHAVTRSIDRQLTNVSSRGIGEDQHLAQGGLVISALDYAKILAMLGNGGMYLSDRILSEDSVSQIHNADVSAPEHKQGLATRFTGGGSSSNLQAGEDDLPLWRREGFTDYVTWQYNRKNDIFVPSDGFYWHTGTGYGVFAQYLYMATEGTDKGISSQFSSRGTVAITTGAWSSRETNGIIGICSHLSSIAWLSLGFDELG